MRGLVLLVLLAACEQSPSQSTPPLGQSSKDEQSTATSIIASLHARDFAAYRVELYPGRKHFPDFAGAQGRFRVYRPLFRQAVNAGPSFAGRYALAPIGCGAHCTAIYLIDVSTGQIIDLSFGGEEMVYQLELAYQRDSNLLKARWQIIPGDRGADAAGCICENFVLRDGRLVSLGRAVGEPQCPPPEEGP